MDTPLRHSRRLGLALALLATVLALLVGPATSAAATPRNGVFEDCAPSAGAVCVDRLAAAQQMGFDLVINGSALSSGPLAAREYAQAAQQLGIEIVWPMMDQGWWDGFDPAAKGMAGKYPAWATACEEDRQNQGILSPGQSCDNQQLLEYMLGMLAQQPNTWGWYAADDSQMRKAGQLAQVAAWTQRLKQLAPQQSTLISVYNTLPAARDAADYVAQETYPFGLPDNPPDWSLLAATARKTERLTPGRSAFILQAFSWGDNIWDGRDVGYCAPEEPPQSCLPKYRYPSSPEQIRQRQTVLLNSRPALMLWYTLSNTLGPYQPRSDPNYSDPSAEESASRVQSLGAAVSGAAPRTRACLRLRRNGRGWVLNGSATQGLGSVASIRWQHRGWRASGHGLRIGLRPRSGQPAASAALTVRDGFGRSVIVKAPLSSRHAPRVRCRALPAI